MAPEQKNDASENVARPKRPCDQCPWRLDNHGKRHAFGFYTKANLRRLWNQIRRGGRAQSCHLTDPTHPDHVAVGAKPGASAQECPGSVILVVRELRQIEKLSKANSETAVKVYLKERRAGLTRAGILYWLLGRAQLGGTIMGSGPRLPLIDEYEPGVGLPEELSR